MNDLVLRHLLWARRRERSVLQRLLWSRDPLLDAGVGDRVETFWARATVRSQHERIQTVRREAPTSRGRALTWAQAASPDRPAPGSFVQAEQRFHLEPTRAVHPCATCQGAGRLECRVCGGRGRTFCEKGSTCPRCRGGDKVRCGACEGRGSGPCARCEGEGRLIAWDEEIWSWTVHEQQIELPAVSCPSAALRRAERRLARRPVDAVPAFDATSLAGRTGRVTEDGLAVASRAASLTEEAEARAVSLDGRCLHLQTERWMLPVAALICRRDGQAWWYALLGGDEAPVEVAAPPRVDPVRLICWSLLLLALVAAAHPSLEPFGRGATGLALGAVGVLGLMGGQAARQRVRVVAVVPTRGPSRTLALLAHVGAHADRLRIPDDLERGLLAELRGEHEHAGSSALVVEAPGAPRLRLIELRGPAAGDARALEPVLAAVDGVIVLTEPRDAAQIAGTRALAARLGRPVATLPYGGATLIGLAEGWLGSRGARSAEIFTRLWAPVRELQAAWSKEGR